MSSSSGSASHKVTRPLLANFQFMWLWTCKMVSGCVYPPSLDKFLSVGPMLYGRSDVRSLLRSGCKDCDFCLRQHVLWGKPGAVSWGYPGKLVQRPPWQETKICRQWPAGNWGLQLIVIGWVFSEAEPGIQSRLHNIIQPQATEALWETLNQDQPAQPPEDSWLSEMMS